MPQAKLIERPYMGLFVYIVIGFLYQYLVYGDAPLNLVSTWVHVLLWIAIVMYYVFIYSIWYLMLISLAVLIGVGTIRAIRHF